MLKLSLLLLLASCAQVKIHSKGKVPVSFKKEKGHIKPVHLEVRKEYFLWGKYPEGEELNIDEILRDKGIVSISQLVIKEQPLAPEKWWTILSFGVYQPKRYVIEGMTVIKE